MSVNFLGLFTGSNIKTAPLTQSSAIASARAVQGKVVSFASVPTANAPRHLDSVPTKYADGTPFWQDYVTPNVCWVG